MDGEIARRHTKDAELKVYLGQAGFHCAECNWLYITA